MVEKWIPWLYQYVRSAHVKAGPSHDKENFLILSAADMERCSLERNRKVRVEKIM